MPICIYCNETRPTGSFSNEHLLTRAFCGEGVNWTLVDTVCKQCNERFSAFEAHWSRSAIEGMMRNFSGPLGRSSQSPATRQQPIECDHIYIVQRDDELVYEAGFAFPNHHYFRPQFLQTGDGLVCLVPEHIDIGVLHEAINDMVKGGTFEVSKPIARGARKAFEVARLTLDFDAKECSIVATRTEDKTSGYWLRSFPVPPNIRSFDGVVGVFTPRCALDDRNRLYFRANDWVGVTALLTDMVKNRYATPAEKSNPEQSVAIRHIINLPIVYRAVMKTGLNFVAKVAGNEVARDSTFDELRRIILDPKADDDVVRYCRILDDTGQGDPSRTDFPPPLSIDEHRLMLDVYGGTVRFRIRLYGTLGYECKLGKMKPKIRERISTARAAVDFGGQGIRKVSKWS